MPSAEGEGDESFNYEPSDWDAASQGSTGAMMFPDGHTVEAETINASFLNIDKDASFNFEASSAVGGAEGVAAAQAAFASNTAAAVSPTSAPLPPLQSAKPAPKEKPKRRGVAKGFGSDITGENASPNAAGLEDTQVTAKDKTLEAAAFEAPTVNNDGDGLETPSGMDAPSDAEDSEQSFMLDPDDIAELKHEATASKTKVSLSAFGFSLDKLDKVNLKLLAAAGAALFFVLLAIIFSARSTTVAPAVELATTAGKVSPAAVDTPKVIPDAIAEEEAAAKELEIRRQQQLLAERRAREFAEARREAEARATRAAREAADTEAVAEAAKAKQEATRLAAELDAARKAAATAAEAARAAKDMSKQRRRQCYMLVCVDV
eukprot:CAMPEP_0118862356 /NCGR_PEP_ID=MMETSP1163-20130328/7586_1 /TAXON_ID=124430 /ORGANISM="Phaeomonas parva, Strain CCMP2877" /LENGTH=375 /DNA_ID=CAMNT_0006796251 /DNA_START=1 /DNA_END=1128 /DNA_ORIENTATION=-